MKHLFFILLIAISTLHANTVIVYNHTQSPLLVWPIPVHDPPYMLANVPNKTRDPNVITAPARLEWPGNAQAVVVVAEKHANVFNKALENAGKIYNEQGKPKRYDWDVRIKQALETQRIPKTDWAIFYPHGSGKDHELLLESFKDYKLVLYNAPRGKHKNAGALTGITASLDKPDEAIPIEKFYGVN